MKAATEPKPQKAAVDLVGDFAAAQVLALSKAVPKARNDKCRKEISVGVHAIDVKVRITGDMEVGADVRKSETISYEDIALAALAQLREPQRRAVYRNTGKIAAPKKAVLEAELETLKAKLPWHWSAGKLTPHLKVELL